MLVKELITWIVAPLTPAPALGGALEAGARGGEGRPGYSHLITPDPFQSHSPLSDWPWWGGIRQLALQYLHAAGEVFSEGEGLVSANGGLPSFFADSLGTNHMTLLKEHGLRGVGVVGGCFGLEAGGVDASAINTAGYPLTPSVHPSVCLPCWCVCRVAAAWRQPAWEHSLTSVTTRRRRRERRGGGGASGASSRQPYKQAGNKQGGSVTMCCSEAARRELAREKVDERRRNHMTCLVMWTHSKELLETRWKILRVFLLKTNNLQSWG